MAEENKQPQPVTVDPASTGYANRMSDDKRELLKKLELVRQNRACGYVNSSRFCDCKYVRGETLHGEQTGCCEIRVAMSLILRMTEREYERLKKRGSHTAGDSLR